MFIVLREENLEIFKKTRDMKNPVKPMNNPKTHYPNTHPENKSGFLPALRAIGTYHNFVQVVCNNFEMDSQLPLSKALIQLFNQCASPNPIPASLQ